MPLALNFSVPVPAYHAWLRVIGLMALAACAAFVMLPSTPGYAQSTVLAPTQPNNDFQEASILYRTGKYDAAMERVDAWLKTRPKDARGRFLRGMIFTQQKKLDDATRVYTELSQDYPELPEPYNNLAVIYADKGEFDKARTLLESAVRANASFSAAHENLGDIHARLAALSYENALKLDATNKAVSAKLKAVNDMIPARAPAAGSVAPVKSAPKPPAK
jgi:Flp pilus assembly protein TadD